MKVRCPDCGKKYLLKGRPKGPSFQCPRCSATIPIPGGEDLSRSALREELSRLAAQGADTGRAGNCSPRVHVTDPDEEQFFSTRGRVMLLIAAILFALVALGGGATWLVMRLNASVTVGDDGLAVVVGNRPSSDDADAGADAETGVQPQTTELPAAVLAALREARKPVPVCQEEQALEKWRTALKMLKEHEGIAADQIAQAEGRIAEFQETLEGRRATVDELQSDLATARASAEDGRKPEARVAVQRILRQLGRLECRGPGAEEVRQNAVALQQGLQESNGEEADPGIKPPAIVDDPDHILDGPAPGTGNRWISENWANPTEIELKGEGEDLYRSLVHKRGSKQKWVVTMARPFDLSDYKFLVLDMRVQEPVRVALGVWAGTELYESDARALPRNDKWQRVAFNLKSDEFKCADTNWNFGARIKDPKAVTKFSLFFYSQARSPVLFTNVRLHKGD